MQSTYAVEHFIPAPGNGREEELDGEGKGHYTTRGGGESCKTCPLCWHELSEFDSKVRSLSPMFI